MDVDILVAGGGTAGLAAAAALGGLGLSVLCVDPAPAGATDLRTTAVLGPGVALLAQAGAWPAPEATPLAVMRIVDLGAGVPVARDFRAGDVGQDTFGFNVPNRALQAALEARIAALPNVELRRGAAFRARAPEGDRVRVTLTDGAATARLLIGADGRDSPVRAACDIEAETWRYGQKAVIFGVTHERPHDGVSIEVHDRGGPFTLVPLPDRDGRPASSVVWMTGGPEAQRLMALPDAAFAGAANARSGGVMGPLTPVGPRQAWPVVTRLARRMTARRTALMAEAAHAVPPIGAQGLNMSLADLAALLALARDRPTEIGDESWLGAYAAARERDVRVRALGIDALNRASQAPLGPLRALGVAALHDVAPLRRALMRLGLG